MAITIPPQTSAPTVYLADFEFIHWHYPEAAVQGNLSCLRRLTGPTADHHGVCEKIKILVMPATFLSKG